MSFSGSHDLHRGRFAAVALHQGLPVQAGRAADGAFAAVAAAVIVVAAAVSTVVLGTRVTTVGKWRGRVFGPLARENEEQLAGTVATRVEAYRQHERLCARLLGGPAQAGQPHTA